MRTMGKPTPDGQKEACEVGRAGVSCFPSGARSIATPQALRRVAIERTELEVKHPSAVCGIGHQHGFRIRHMRADALRRLKMLRSNSR